MVCTFIHPSVVLSFCLVVFPDKIISIFLIIGMLLETQMFLAELDFVTKKICPNNMEKVPKKGQK